MIGELAQFTLRIWTDHPVTFNEVTETFHEQYYDGQWRPDDIDPDDITPLPSSSLPPIHTGSSSGRVKKKKKKIQRIEAAGAVGEWSGEDREASLSLLRATRNQQLALRCTNANEPTTCVVALLQVIKDAHLDLLCMYAPYHIISYHFVSYVSNGDGPYDMMCYSGFHLLKVTPSNGATYVGFTSSSTPCGTPSASTPSSFLTALAASATSSSDHESPTLSSTPVPRLRSRKRVSFVDQPLAVKDNVPASHHLTVDESEVSQVFRTEFSVTVLIHMHIHHTLWDGTVCLIVSLMFSGK